MNRKYRLDERGTVYYVPAVQKQKLRAGGMKMMTRDHRDVSSPNRINCFRTNQGLFYELTARWIRAR